MDVQKERDALTHKTFQLMIRVAIIFAIPAAVAYFVGKWIDTTYDVRPTGTLIVLGISFVGSWAVVIRMYLKLDKEFRALREKEEQKESE